MESTFDPLNSIPASDQAYTVQKVFMAVLTHIQETGWVGACHSSSAMLHILLKESGVDSEILIGEVFYPGYRFDHSWVEVNGEILDAAVAFPLRSGIRFGGPVFLGVDLDTSMPTELQYGVGAPGRLDIDAWEIATQSLGEYFEYADEDAREEAELNAEPAPPELWDRVAEVAIACGLVKSSAALAMAHEGTRRTERYAVQ